MVAPTEIEKQVSELEIAVDRVRSLYEQYFMGIEKLEPTVPRKDVDRKIHLLRKEQIRNTAQRFRFQMILQRYNTYQTHWMRICREIENGTYKRHVIRAEQRFGEARAAGKKVTSMAPPPMPALTRDLAAELAELDREFAAPEEVDELDVELLEDAPPKPGPAVPRPGPGAPPPPRPPKPGPVWRKAGASPAAAAAVPPVAPTRAPVAPVPGAAAAAVPRPAGRPSAPPLRVPPAPSATVRAAAAAPLPRPALRAPDDLPDERVRAIYAQYVDAKRKQNESTATITYDAVAKSLRDSSAKLREKHGKAVDFEVAVKDGKAILKPVLK